MCVCVCGCVCWEGHRYLSILVTESVRVCVRARCEGHRFLSILVAEGCVCVCVCACTRALMELDSRNCHGSPSTLVHAILISFYLLSSFPEVDYIF